MKGDQAFGGERRDVTRAVRLVILIVLRVTNFHRYFADIRSRDKTPSGPPEELFVLSALPSLREKLPDFWHPFRSSSAENEGGKFTLNVTARLYSV